MPTRGYRKGVSDDKVASPRRVYTRLPQDVHVAVTADADRRGMPAASIIRAIVTAHYRQHRVELPNPRTADAALLYEWNRAGNNLNQLVRQAHLMKLHLLEQQARACVAVIRSLIERSA
jgi:hypothetical protein